jgi:predicted carbohydrate-binding protein with CBM5 and CBM33 domain
MLPVSRPARPARLLAAGIVAPLLGVAVAGAAFAHGAPQDPVSRSFACGPQGSKQRTAACRAARAGDQGEWFQQWDYVRVANVNGRDRELIPDGQLCSGGVEHFGGLDLARRDWPSTSLRAGQKITVSYRATIAHAGSFRVYVTKNGYDPTRRLRWADLAAKPFLTAKDPNFADGAYKFTGTLPGGMVGRHVIYTIWQNSGTPDTYYSCSDVVFPKSATATAARSSRRAGRRRVPSRARAARTARLRPAPTRARPPGWAPASPPRPPPSARPTRSAPACPAVRVAAAVRCPARCWLGSACSPWLAPVAPPWSPVDVATDLPRGLPVVRVAEMADPTVRPAMQLS